MGFFGDYVWVNGCWATEAPEDASPVLAISIEDSDIASVSFAPAKPGSAGRCYLGYEPRHYYEDPAASDPVDVGAESASLAEWAQAATGTKVSPRDIKKLLASPKGRDPKDDFVEETLGRLVVVLGLPALPTPSD